MEILIRNEAELERAAGEFLGALGMRRHVALHAPMGAGKTTFTGAVCRTLGLADEVSSPTFSIINEYCGADAVPAVYHFDFYRIDSPEEILDLGLDEYFDSDALCLMEWPERAAGFLPDDTVEVSIEVLPDESRRIIIPD